MCPKRCCIGRVALRLVIDMFKSCEPMRMIG